MDKEKGCCENAPTERNPSLKTLNCDEMAWLKDVFERYGRVRSLQFPSVSRNREVAITAAILEIMEILNLGMDEGAKHNLRPRELR